MECGAPFSASFGSFPNQIAEARARASVGETPCRAPASTQRAGGGAHIGTEARVASGAPHERNEKIPRRAARHAKVSFRLCACEHCVRRSLASEIQACPPPTHTHPRTHDQHPCGSGLRGKIRIARRTRGKHTTSNDSRRLGVSVGRRRAIRYLARTWETPPQSLPPLPGAPKLSMEQNPWRSYHGWQRLGVQLYWSCASRRGWDAGH